MGKAWEGSCADWFGQHWFEVGLGLGSMHAARRAFHDAQMGWKPKSGDPIFFVPVARYRVLPGSAQKGAGPSSAWVSGLVAADSCDMFSGLSWAGTRGRESGAWF